MRLGPGLPEIDPYDVRHSYATADRDAKIGWNAGMSVQSRPPAADRPQPGPGAGSGNRAGPEDRRMRAARHQDHAGIRAPLDRRVRSGGVRQAQ